MSKEKKRPAKKKIKKMVNGDTRTLPTYFASVNKDREYANVYTESLEQKLKINAADEERNIVSLKRRIEKWNYHLKRTNGHSFLLSIK